MSAVVKDKPPCPERRCLSGSALSSQPFGTGPKRLWKQEGKTAEARQMLARIYGWFTEGFDTVDLKDTKALLEELR
jgi:hypothetical protein